MKCTLSIGTTNIDVLVRANAASAPHHRDKKGSVDIAIGGSATNAALGFHRLSCQSRLLTAMSQSPLSAMLQNWLISTGIDLICDDLPTSEIGAFVAQIDEHGELESAVSQCPIESYSFTRGTLEKAMTGVDLAVVDANLSNDSLLDVADVAKTMNVPLAIMTVSEDKAVRVLTLKGKVQLVLTNHLEAEKLMAQIGAADPAEISEYMECLVIVTRGERGASAYYPDGRKERVRAPILTNPTNHLGFGDATTAALALGVLGLGMGVQEASYQFADELVREISTSESCNTSSGSITAIITDLVDRGKRDHLTRLLMRGGFEDAFRRLKGPNNTLLAIDVDNFKLVNDEHGHDCGDKVLSAIAKEITLNTRSEDLAARYGGDEFSLILINTPILEAQPVAERIRAAVEAAGLFGATLSIGVASIHPDETLQSVMARADENMYRAKRTGKNKVVLVD